MDKVNILLVDDQPGKLLSLETILAPLSENLVLAKSGREALQYLLKRNARSFSSMWSCLKWTASRPPR